MASPVEPTDRCPRCGGRFHCGAQDAAPCGCSALTLPPELLADLRQRYSGCLCLGCLQALSATDSVNPEARSAAQTPAAP